MDRDEVTYDEVTEWTKSVGREELVQIITDIANKYYLPRILVKDIKNESGFKMAGWLKKLMEEDDVNDS